MKPTPGKLNPEDVRRLANEGYGVLEIARRLRRRNDLIVTTLRDLGIRSWPDKPWLEEHYINHNESINDIAAHWQVTEAAIRHHLRRHGIPIRYKTRGRIQNSLLADGLWLEARYVTEGRSLQEVADLAQCRVGSLVSALTRHGISRRLPPNGRYHSRRRCFTGQVRQVILERDGYRCRWPGCNATTWLEINHIIPTSEGGDTTAENGITLCRKHHRGIARREGDFVELFSALIA
jgi:hypothetical protein